MPEIFPAIPTEMWHDGFISLAAKYIDNVKLMYVRDHLGTYAVMV